MYVADFRWSSVGLGIPRPTNPVIVYSTVQKSPASGAFAGMVVAAITESPGPEASRYFVCSVGVEDDENKPGWQDAMKALLVRECIVSGAELNDSD